MEKAWSLTGPLCGHRGSGRSPERGWGIGRHLRNGNPGCQEESLGFWNGFSVGHEGRSSERVGGGAPWVPNVLGNTEHNL